MIGYLRGTIKKKENQSLIIDVNGVGYQVFMPLFVWQNSKLGDEKELLIYTYVREDEITLFGFLKPKDKRTFINLISVSGIGSSLALNILSYAKGADKIIQAIEKADVDFFSEVKGIGKKSAQRIIVDLKPKIGGLKEIEFEEEKDADLIEALKGLGFSRKEIKKAAKGIDRNLPLEEKIRQALKEK